MQQNAIKFNGGSSLIAGEAVAIYEFVREQVESSRSGLTPLEDAVQEQLSGKPKKKRKKKQSKPSSASPDDVAVTNVGMVGGVEVNLGDVDFNFDEIDSDSDDDSYAGVLKGL